MVDFSYFFDYRGKKLFIFTKLIKLKVLDTNTKEHQFSSHLERRDKDKHEENQEGPIKIF